LRLFSGHAKGAIVRVRLVWVLRLLVLGLVVTVVLAGLERVERANEDTDADGIPDCTERAGLASATGRELGATDHELADTDGDGVADGDEVVMSPPSTWLEERLDRSWSCPSEIRSALSDPARADTDGDLLVDAYEISAGSSAFVGDTDGDGLSDGRERGWGSDPNAADTDGDGFPDVEDVIDGFTPVTPEERISPDAWASELRQGVLEGDIAEEVDSVPQLLGSLVGGASSSVPGVGWVTGSLADARDVVANGIRGDWVSAGAAGVGFLPYIGDTAKASKQILTFAARYPDKVNALVKALAGQERIPVDIRVKLLGVTNETELDRLRQSGLSDDVIIMLAKRGALLAGLVATLSKATGEHGIPATYADSDGFATSFADAENALRAYALDRAGEVEESPVYIGDFPEQYGGGRLVDVCSGCSPRPLPGQSTLRVAKLGTQLYSKTLQAQIDKDDYLVEQGYAVEWHFFAGRTGLLLDPRLLDALVEADVPFHLHLPA
jgi:hypothetical protein